MASTKPPAERKGWYHSDLVKISPTRLQFTGPIQESKYGRANWVGFKLENGEEHTLEMENEDVEAVVANATRDVWLTVQAAGSRDAATLEILGSKGSKPPRRAFDDEPESDWGEPPVEMPPAAVAHGVFERAAGKPTLRRQMWDCLDKAAEVVATFKQRHGHEPTEAERSIALAFLIEQNRNGGREL